MTTSRRVTRVLNGRGAGLTFLQTALRGGEHLINSEGIGSLFVAFILHFLDVWQAVHGTAEISFPCLWIWTVDAWLVFTFKHSKLQKIENEFKYRCRWLLSGYQSTHRLHSVLLRFDVDYYH